MKINFKRILFILLLLSVSLSSFGTICSANDAKSWYTPRNGNDQPIFSNEAKKVKDHGAYYIDEGVNNSSERKVIYLTFDFGYENGNVERIVDILNEENVPAAFFILDNPIIKNTALIKKIAESGHLVCNHTRNHRDLTKCSEEEIEKSIKQLETIYEQKTGLKMSKYFRFPEGRYSIRALDKISSLGYKTIFWSFAYADWDNNDQPDNARAFKKIISNTHNGAVMLFHPTSETNANILKELIHKWREMGYKFGTLDDLCLSCDSVKS